MNKSYELLVRFPLSQIENLYHFRFELVEPLIENSLQAANMGICDYGFCDDDFLNMVAYVNDIPAAVAIICQELKANNINIFDSIWVSEQGVAQSKII